MWFQQEDWQLFRNIETIGQAAGVPSSKIAMLVVKELVDNALDACGNCEIDKVGDNGFYVKDSGNGIDDIESMFSINRPLTSTKRLRLPQRGALGNGLRVVVGAVFSTHGKLIVSTKGKTYDLIPRNDGTTKIQYLGEYQESGTRIEVSLGIAAGNVDLTWGKNAIVLSRGEYYKGKTSAYWYTNEAFYDLCLISRNTSVLELVSEFDGCTGTKAGHISAGLKGRQANTLNKLEVESILQNMRTASRPVNPDRLGNVGEFNQVYQYVKSTGVYTLKSSSSQLHAEIPFVVEAWAEMADKSSVISYVNRTRIVGEINCYYSKSTLSIWGCELNFDLSIGRNPMKIIFNIITPYMQITSNGKQPDLSHMQDVIYATVEKAIKKVKKVNKLNKIDTPKAKTQKEVMLDNLCTAIDKASGGGEYRFSLRQLYYATRPYVIDGLGTELEYGYFCGVITDYENENGDIRHMYRDERGTLYHPHLKQDISLGTISVEEYTRPDWTFNKILYCEKEGFFPILKAVNWPEKHDCAIMTSKGFASRATKDLLDLLGDTKEEITFFCIHDADAAGTLIYESLQNETKSRPERKVNVINLGLEPKEGIVMGLAIEKVEETKRNKPVAEYVEPKWAKWLQSHRIELNAMTTPQFIQWLDCKMKEHNGKKLVPPDEVLINELHENTRTKLKNCITDRILEESNIDNLVEAAYSDLIPKLEEFEDTINLHVNDELSKNPILLWKEPINQMVNNLV